MRPCSRHVLENELEGCGCLVIRHELIQDKAVIQRKARTESMRGHNEGDYMGQIVNVLTSSDPQMVLTSNPQEETTAPPSALPHRQMIHRSKPHHALPRQQRVHKSRPQHSFPRRQVLCKRRILNQLLSTTPRCSGRSTNMPKCTKAQLGLKGTFLATVVTVQHVWRY